MKRIMFLFSLILMLGVCASIDAQMGSQRVDSVYCYDVNTDLVHYFNGFKTLPIDNPYVTSILENGYAIGFKISASSLDILSTKGDYWDFPVQYISNGSTNPEPAYIRIKFAK